MNQLMYLNFFWAKLIYIISPRVIFNAKSIWIRGQMRVTWLVILVAYNLPQRMHEVVIFYDASTHFKSKAATQWYWGVLTTINWWIEGSRNWWTGNLVNFTKWNFLYACSISMDHKELSYEFSYACMFLLYVGHMWWAVRL